MILSWIVVMRWHIICSIVAFLQKTEIVCAKGVECVYRTEVSHSVLTGRQGSISSPFYPNFYPEHACCTWTFDISPGNILVLRVHDLDIEEDPGCKTTSCCHHSWMSLPRKEGGSQKLCGLSGGSRLIVASPPKAIIKFYTSKVFKGGRGFNLTYSFEQEASACVHWNNHTQCEQADLFCYDETQHCNEIKDCPSGVDEEDCCRADEIICSSRNGCYTREQICDGHPDCEDYSDEENCGYCPMGMTGCNGEHRFCFEISQRCDGELDCPCGEDEINCKQEASACVHWNNHTQCEQADLFCYDEIQHCNPSCPGKIACTNGNGCFTPSDIRNNERMCFPPLDADGSRLVDVLRHTKFRCDNGQCIPISLWCDGKDNCGDNSDELSCVKNSVITAAIMGALTCGLLLVVAVGCMCRLYSGRLHAAGAGPPFWSAGLASRARPALAPTPTPAPAPPLPLPPAPDGATPVQGYALQRYVREPPPAYSVAVGAGDYQQLTRLQPAPPPPPTGGRAGGGRRARRHGPGLRRAARHRLPPVSAPEALPAEPAAPVALAVPATLAASAGAPGAATSTVSTLETSLAGEGKPCGNGDVGDGDGEGEGGRSDAASVSPCGSTASSLSPSRDSFTSSTSLLSYLSGADEDAPLLVIPPS